MPNYPPVPDPDSLRALDGTVPPPRRVIPEDLQFDESDDEINENFRATAAEEWDNNEAERLRRDLDGNEDDEDSGSFDLNENDNADEKIMNSRRHQEQLRQIAAYLREEEAAEEFETDPVKRYRNRVDSPDTIKIFSPKHLGYRILSWERSETEKFEIDKSRFDILKLVYSRHEDAVEANKAMMMDWSRMDEGILMQMDNFVADHGKQSVRQGAMSVASDPHLYEPKLHWRGHQNDQQILLRPVVVDGVAVLHASNNFDGYPFMGKLKNCEKFIYDHNLNLHVKNFFDIILLFLIRGHKVTVYLPMYYKKYLTKSNVSKVDDIIAFKTLLDLGFIEFTEVKFTEHDAQWFVAMSKLADHLNAVFVSSYDCQSMCKSPQIVEDRVKFSKCSDRIITPCFSMSEPSVLVLEPLIRFKKEPGAEMIMISPEQILHFGNHAISAFELEQQLYLEDQIRLICELCQLYPLNGQNKISVKQLLALVVHAGSDFEMQNMTIDDYFELYERREEFNAADNY